MTVPVLFSFSFSFASLFLFLFPIFLFLVMDNGVEMPYSGLEKLGKDLLGRRPRRPGPFPFLGLLDPAQTQPAVERVCETKLKDQKKNSALLGRTQENG